MSWKSEYSLTIDLWMESMKNCDECYLMRQPQTEKCPHCGKMTWVGQVVGISMHWECSECGWCCISAGGFPPICHGDEELYTIIINKPDNKATLVRLAKLLNMNVLDLNNQFESGVFERECKVIECIELYNNVCKLGISCQIDNRIEKTYSRILKCPYA